MIKARQGNTIILALDQTNIERLLDHKPILIKGKELLLQDLEIIIIANATLADCKEDLRSMGITEGHEVKLVASTYLPKYPN